ncbi:MAG: response regulator transcription factor [Crocinitomicaceae bacterium]|nr:response regulator transcription factor [Crocinitomicaceae bacterium]
MRIVLADKSDLVKIGLRNIISSIENTQVIGEASEKKELIELISSFKADLLIIDYTSNDFDLDLLKKLKSINKQLKIIAVTQIQDPKMMVKALKSGVDSYVKKDCDLMEIKDAITETFSGNQFFCGEILKTINIAKIDINDLNIDLLTCNSVILTSREKEIIELISEGLTNFDISEKLFISKHTVNTHRKNIMHKIGVKNTAGIVIYAVKSNIISPNKFLFAQ